VGAAVLREGAEVVLFLYGIAVGGADSMPAMLIGGMLGLAAGAAVAWLIYRGLLAIPPGKLLNVTGWLIVLVAAGMASQAVQFLQQAGYLEFMEAPLWSTRAILPDASVLGRLARALVGYTDEPNGLQLVAWLLTVALARLTAQGTPRGGKGHAPVARPSR
jgi:high-affinity iron transporter